MVEPAWQVFTKDEKYFLRGKGGYVIFSENFWGVGNQTLFEDDYLNASYNRTYFQGDFYWKIRGKLFMGVTSYFSDVRSVKFDDTERVNDIDPFLGGFASEIKGFSLPTTRYSGGAGLRILINRQMNLYTRLDFAVTSDRTSGFYFRIFDAF